VEKRSRNWVITSASAGVLALALTTFGIASAGSAEPQVENIRTIVDWRDISLPLDAYEMPLNERNIILSAEYRLTAQCMSGFGLHLGGPDWGTLTTDLPVKTMHYRLYGLLDSDHATRYGYHSPTEAQKNPEQRSSDSIPGDYSNVLGAKLGGGEYDGKPIPEGGCIGLAQKQIEDETSGQNSLIEDLGFRTWTAASRDSRVESAFGAWSACMSEAGFSYDKPEDANNDEAFSGTAISQREIDVAISDVECKKKTNLIGIRTGVESAYQEEEIRLHADDLAQLLKKHDEAIDRARKVLSAS
jgi:hypothetical protein